ncbi:amidohydrolase family protein [Anaerotignum faecicola]|nr:amidohydrolase family protein [Anaerotignum faecicola]
MKIIDGHIHFRPEYENFSEVAASSGHINSEKHLKEVFEKNNICHAIVMGNLDLELENHIYPEYMSYCVGLDSNTFNERPLKYFVEMAELHLKRDECVGIKLYPGYCHFYVYDEIYEPFYKLAEKYNKPVAIHTGAVANTKKGGSLLKYSHPLTVDEAAVSHPGVNFVMCHFGNPWLCDAASVIEKNRNVYADISGILEGRFDVGKFINENLNYINMIKTWLGYIGDYSRIIYGTDWPIVNIENYLEFARFLIPESEHEKVFYENAKRIYGLKI